MRKKFFLCVFAVLILALCTGGFVFLKDNSVVDEDIADFENVFISAQNNENSYMMVSGIIIEAVRGKKTSDVSVEWNDYINDVSSDEKKAFENIFVDEKAKLCFMQGDECIETVFFVYRYMPEGDMGVVYLDNYSDISNHYLEFLDEYGETKKINENLYAYYYELPYV